MSSSSYYGYADLLKLSATYIDVPLAPNPAPVPAPTPTPTPTPTTTPTPPPVNLRSGDYTSTKLEVTMGAIAVGSATNLNVKDLSYLTIKSVTSSGYSYLDWTAEFTLPSQQVSSLGLSYSGKYSAYRGQYIYLYNYSTSTWQKVSYYNVGIAMVNINLPSIANPASFVSTTGQVRVKVSSMSSSSYYGYFDLLKINVTY
jgi:hypothetical protein